MADPQAAQVGAFKEGVAGVADDGQSLGVQVNGLPVVAQVEWQFPSLARPDPWKWLLPVSRAMARAWVYSSIPCRNRPSTNDRDPIQSGGQRSGGVDDLPVDARVQVNEGAVVAPHLQVALTTH